MDCNDDFQMEEPENGLEKDNLPEQKHDVPQSQRDIKEQAEIEQHGGDRKDKLTTFSTIRVNGLVPAHRQTFRDLNLDDENEVMQWCMQYNTSKEVIAAWQTDLLNSSSQETFTPSRSPPTPSSESQWSEENSMDEQKDPIMENSMQEYIGIRRFRGEADNPANSRLHIKHLKSEWNSIRDQWENQTEVEFPEVPNTASKWKIAISAAPKLLRSLLQQFESPDYLLSDMTEANLDLWTKAERLECLLYSLETLANNCNSTDPTSATWIRTCIQEYNRMIWNR